MRTRDTRRQAETRGFASSIGAVLTILLTPLLDTAPAVAGGDGIVGELEHIGSNRFEYEAMWPRLFDAAYDADHSGAVVITEDGGTFVYAVVDDVPEGESGRVGRARYQERQRFELPVLIESPVVAASGVSVGLLEETNGSRLATLALTITLIDAVTRDEIATAFVPMAWFRTVGGALQGAQVWVRLLTEVATIGTAFVPRDGLDVGLSVPPPRVVGDGCRAAWVTCRTGCEDTFRGPLFGTRTLLAACLVQCIPISVPYTSSGPGPILQLHCMLRCTLTLGRELEALLVEQDECLAGCDRQRKRCDPDWSGPYI